jgi:hypothetical protein
MIAAALKRSGAAVFAQRAILAKAQKKASSVRRAWRTCLEYLPLPSSQMAQLWNQCSPLMFLWLPNANSGALERPLWQTVALCRPDQASAV